MNKFSFLLIVFIFLSSCTIASKNKHYLLSNHQSKVFDKAQAKWCYQSAMNANIEICSASFESLSTSYGLIFPLIPIKSERSRYAFDIKNDPLIEIYNRSQNNDFELAQLNKVMVCDLFISEKCAKQESVIIKPGQRALIKLPKLEEIKILFKINGHTFYEKLEETTDKHWSIKKNDDVL